MCIKTELLQTRQEPLLSNEKQTLFDVAHRYLHTQTQKGLTYINQTQERRVHQNSFTSWPNYCIADGLVKLTLGCGHRGINS